MSERQIDEAIDAAVRDLMNVDADPAFRARVVDRLRQPKSRFGLGWRQLSVAAAALVVVVGVVLMRGGAKPVVHPPSSHVASSALAKTAPRAGSQPPQITPNVEPRPAVRTPRRQAGDVVTHQIARGSLVATVAGADAGSPAPALGEEPLEPIRMEPIGPAVIVVPEVRIAPLAPVSEIVITPLESGRERN
jgi:hypothetical protein